MRAWAALSASLRGVAWYRPAGNIEWAAGTGRAQLTARVRRLAAWEYPARLIDAAQAAEIEPSLRLPGPACAFAWFPDEGYLLTEPLIRQLARRAAQHGATLLTGEAGRVVGLDAPGGVVRAVRTAVGHVIPADAVVCCAGRQVPEVAALADAACPVPLVQWAVPGATAPGLVVQVGPVIPPGPTRVVHTPEVYLRPHSRGLVHLEAPDAAVDLHTPPTELRRWSEELLRRARDAGGWPVNRGLASRCRRALCGGDAQRRDPRRAPGPAHDRRTRWRYRNRRDRALPARSLQCCRAGTGAELTAAWTPPSAHRCTR